MRSTSKPHLNLTTLAIATFGGYMLNITGLPLAWLLGSMLAIAISSNVVGTLQIATNLRLGATAILGTMVGTMVDTKSLALLISYAPSILCMLSFQIILVALGTWYLQCRAGTDRLSALMGAYPGSISQITALSLDNQCNSRLIVMNHSARLFFVIAFIPLIITTLTGETAATDINQSNKSTISDYLWPATLALSGYFLGKVTRLISPALFGPMILTIILNIGGFQPIFTVGEWLMPAAQVIIGSAIGLRFRALNKEKWQMMASIHLPYGVLLLLATLLASIGVHIALDLPLEVSLLIMAPGGLSEIVLIAYALDIDPVMITSHHVIRSLFGFLLIPLLMRFWAKPSNHSNDLIT